MTLLPCRAKGQLEVLREVPTRRALTSGCPESSSNTVSRRCWAGRGVAVTADAGTTPATPVTGSPPAQLIHHGDRARPRDVVTMPPTPAPHPGRARRRMVVVGLDAEGDGVSAADVDHAGVLDTGGSEPSPGWWSHRSRRWVRTCRSSAPTTSRSRRSVPRRWVGAEIFDLALVVRESFDVAAGRPGWPWRRRRCRYDCHVCCPPRAIVPMADRNIPRPSMDGR